VWVSEWNKAMTAGASCLFGPGLEKAGTEDFERQRYESVSKQLELVDYRRIGRLLDDELENACFDRRESQSTIAADSGAGNQSLPLA
jgi:hypothetical protein